MVSPNYLRYSWGEMRCEDDRSCWPNIPPHIRQVYFLVLGHGSFRFASSRHPGGGPKHLAGFFPAVFIIGVKNSMTSGKSSFMSRVYESGRSESSFVKELIGSRCICLPSLDFRTTAAFFGETIDTYDHKSSHSPDFPFFKTFKNSTFSSLIPKVFKIFSANEISGASMAFLPTFLYSKLVWLSLPLSTKTSTTDPFSRTSHKATRRFLFDGNATFLAET